MLFPIINQQISTLSLSKSELASRSGLSRPTVRLILQGRGTVASLSSMLPVLGLKWNGADDAGRRGAALSNRRRALGLTQAQVATVLHVSRPVIIGLERDLCGEVATLCAYAKFLSFHSLIVPNKAKRRLVPKTNDIGADRVMTPPALAQALCAHFSPYLSGRILDPARGAGAF
jgi:transcriptional regulator with XRE-family HTH domain